MKLLHCADIHLDSPMRGLSRYEGAPVDAIRGATRRALENLVDLALDEGVSSVVIAGDLYDGERDDYNTAIYLQRQLARLREGQIPVVIAYGNHDAASEITRRLRPPDNVMVFPHFEAQTVVLHDAGLALHGWSYAKRDVTDNLAAQYPSRVPDLLNVGVLHTCLDGRPGHDPYAPCTVDELLAKEYAYWALGHVHEAWRAHHQGTWIVFPGNLQGRHARETGAKGAVIVTYDDAGITAVESRVLDSVRWVRAEVDATGALSVDEVCNRVYDSVSLLLQGTDGRLCAVRVVVTGATTVADKLTASREGWEAQLRADMAGGFGCAWLERIELSVAQPSTRPPDGEAFGAVRQALTRIAQDSDSWSSLNSVLTSLRMKLGADAQRTFELGAPELSGEGVREVLNSVEALLLSKLGGRG